MKCLLLFTLILVFNIIIEVNSYRIVCYFANWSVYRRGAGKFEISNIDPTLCTHYIYAFAGLSVNGEILVTDEAVDITGGGYSNFNLLRNQNPEIVTMIAIGGGKAGDESFTEVVTNATKLTTFVNNIVDFIGTHGFRGADIDWEFPAADQKEAYMEMLRQLRAKFDENGYVLSAAVPGDYGTVRNAYDITAIAQYLDFFNVMTYDMHGAWQNATGENSPLYAGPADHTIYSRTENVDYIMHFYINDGAPSEKLNLGIGTYGRSFTLSDPADNGVGAPISGPGKSGPYKGGTGSLSYNEICMMINEGKLTEYWNGDQFSAFATHGDQWVGYDNIRAIEQKVDFIKENAIGGAMVWTIDMDDFSDTCGTGNYPLLSTIKVKLI